MAEASEAKFEWSQNDSEVVVKVPTEAGKDKLKVIFTSAELSISISGQSVLKKELSGKVVPDDSYWSFEGTGADRNLVVTLCKKKSGSWRALSKDEESALPEKSVLDDDFDVMNLEHDDDDPERVEEQEENERKLEARYKKLLSEKGLQSEDTLETFFALFDNCIQLYRLNKLSDYLAEVVPACRKRTDKYKLKAIQALAFVRWKQSKFSEALPLMLEMEEILGKGAALCENIAHTYNSLGKYNEAEEYFRQSLKFIEQEHGPNKGNRGGVLLGLGLVRDRLGKHKEALPVCQKAYEFYKERANGAPASLQAKAGISCAKINAKLGNLPKAEAYIREAVQMYEVTCGETSPLTASAYHELGKCLWAQRKRDDAQKALKRAYEIEAMKDAWDLVTLLEIHNLLMDTHLKETEQIERVKFADYFKTSEFVVNRVKKELPQDGNAAVYYKAAGEMKAWGGRYAEAKLLFELAIPLLRAEKSTDCSGLIQACNDMLAFCDRNISGTQQSPMEFEVPQSSSTTSGAQPVDEDEDDAMEGGVKIEELDDDEEIAKDAASASAAAGGTSDQVEAAEMPALEIRPAKSSDFILVAALGADCGCEPLFTDEAGFTSYVSHSSGGLCLAAMYGQELAGFAFCSSDGVFGHLHQLLPVGSPEAEPVRRQLANMCVMNCRANGLRALHTSVSVDGSDDLFFEDMGWSASHKVYSIDTADRPAKQSQSSGTSAASSSSACAADPVSKEPSKLRRDGKTTNEYYGSWDKLNVEKTLIADDGMDPSIVPEAVKPVEDFGVGSLDVSSKITRYSWDQSDKFVSLYLPFEGVAALPADAVQVIFRSHGVLVLINDASGKQNWFKVPNLCKEIDLDASTKKVKTNDVVVKLRKVETGETWSDLTDEKDQYQKKREYRINHGDLKGATTEELLADMYKNATDEERAGLRDAMKVNRQKREEEAKNSRK